MGLALRAGTTTIRAKSLFRLTWQQTLFVNKNQQDT
jgi:hypothetical protein